MATLKNQLKTNRSKAEEVAYASTLYDLRVAWASREFLPAVMATLNTTYLMQLFGGAQALSILGNGELNSLITYPDKGPSKLKIDTHAYVVKLNIDPGWRTARINFHIGINLNKEIPGQMHLYVAAGTSFRGEDIPNAGRVFLRMPSPTEDIALYVKDILHKCMDYFLQQDLSEKYLQGSDSRYKGYDYAESQIYRLHDTLEEYAV
jgi:hypothetical protein